MNIQKLKERIKEQADLPNKILQALDSNPRLRELVPQLFETTTARLCELERLWCWIEAMEQREKEAQC